jgi:predicted XRE-type DNA-binding protein
MMSKCLKILREATTNPEKLKAARVYNWATHLQGEAIKDPTENYYMTEDARRLEFMLTHSNEAFIGVIGLQGIGKTRLLEMLAKRFEDRGKKTLFFRWLPDWQERLKETEFEFMTYKAKCSMDKLPSLSSAAFLSDFSMIFIDLPDYNKKNRDAMSKDLRNIESLWKQVADLKKSEEVTKTNGDLTTTIYVSKRKTMTTLVLGIQKEMYGGHFFLGKLIAVELSPMKPNEMVEAYKSKWDNAEPFTEEALQLTAELSRGIFRRYLKYIRKSIESAVLGNNNFPISIETINKEITTKQLVADMDLELTDLFQNNREHKEMAVKTLHLLREKQVNQKEIAEYLNVDEATASRLVKKLEAYSYIRRQRGSGTEWLITLA